MTESTVIIFRSLLNSVRQGTMNIAHLREKLKRHSFRELPHLMWVNARYHILDDLKYHIAYRYPAGYAPFPRSVNIKLTNRCNLACKMCGQTRSRHAHWQKDEVRPDEWIAFIDSIKHRKPYISFWGGEPLMYEGFIDILNFIEKNGLQTGMITNGILLGKYAAQLAKFDSVNYAISLDGPPEIHDVVRNKYGVFDSLKQGIEQLQEARRIIGKEPKGVSLIFSTVTPENQYHIEEMIKTAEQFKPKNMYISYLTFVTPEMIRATNAITRKELGVDYDLDAFATDVSTYDIPHLEEMTRRMHNNEFTGNFHVQFNPKISVSDVKRYYQDTRYAMGRSTCYRPWFIAEILPNGQMHFCPDFIGHRFGDIRTELFSDIWNSKEARKFRMLLKQKKLFPMCNRCCGLLTLQPRKILEQH